MTSLLSNLKNRVFYGWWILIASIIINTVNSGTRYSYGVFFKSIEEEFDLTRAATSGIFSVYMVICGIVAILGGWVLDRYGPRKMIMLSGIFSGISLLLSAQATEAWHLLISYSLLLAIGTGAVFTILVSTAARWFRKKRGFAVGMASGGQGAGMLLISPLVAYLITNFGWRNAYIVTGLITLVLMVLLSLLLKKEPGEMGLFPDGEKTEAAETGAPLNATRKHQADFSLAEALKTSQFWFLWFLWVFLAIVVHLGTTHVVPHATDLGIPTLQAALILTIIGGAMVLGTFVLGSLSDIIGRKKVGMLCTIFTAGAMAWLIWAQDLWIFYLFAAVLGFCWGGLSAALAALISDMFGLRSIGVITGFQVLAWVLGAAIGPYAAGFIFDVTHDYSLAFLLGTIAMLVATLLVASIKTEINAIPKEEKGRR